MPDLMSGISAKVSVIIFKNDDKYIYLAEREVRDMDYDGHSEKDKFIRGTVIPCLSWAAVPQ